MPDIDESKDPEQCRLAFKAALDTVSKYCGGTSQFKIELTPGNFIEVPAEVMMRLRPDEGESVRNINQTKWSEDIARGLCDDVLEVPRSAKVMNDCIDRVKEKLAKAIWNAK